MGPCGWFNMLCNDKLQRIKLILYCYKIFTAHNTWMSYNLLLNAGKSTEKYSAFVYKHFISRYLFAYQLRTKKRLWPPAVSPRYKKYRFTQYSFRRNKFLLVNNLLNKKHVQTCEWNVFMNIVVIVKFAKSLFFILVKRQASHICKVQSRLHIAQHITWSRYIVFLVLISPALLHRTNCPIGFRV